MTKHERFIITGTIYDLNGLKILCKDEFNKMTLERAVRKLQELVDDDDYYKEKRRLEEIKNA